MIIAGEILAGKKCTDEIGNRKLGEEEKNGGEISASNTTSLMSKSVNQMFDKLAARLVIGYKKRDRTEKKKGKQ